jgi:hypothetical protein
LLAVALVDVPELPALPPPQPHSKATEHITAPRVKGAWPLAKSTARIIVMSYRSGKNSCFVARLIAIAVGIGSAGRVVALRQAGVATRQA